MFLFIEDILGYAYIVQCTVNSENKLFIEPNFRMNLSCNGVILSTNRQVK